MRRKEHGVTFHGDDAAVNVKLHNWRELDLEALEAVAADQGAFRQTRREFAAWYSALSDEKRQEWADLAISDGWSVLSQTAEDVFGTGFRAYSEGRSGGWAVPVSFGTRGFSPEDVAGWTPEDFAKWAAFETACRNTCADLPRSAAWLAYVNGFEPEVEARETARRFAFYYDAPASFETMRA